MVLVAGPLPLSALPISVETISDRSPGPSTAWDLYLKGYDLQQQGTPASLKQAIATYQKALQAPDLQGNVQLQAQIYQALGTAYFIQSDYRKAVTAHQRSLTLFQQIDDPYSQALQGSLTAMTLNELGETQQALELSQQALKILDLNPPKADLESAYTNLEVTLYSELGRLHRQRGQIDQAIVSLQTAIQLRQEQHNRLEQANLMESLGLIYLDRGEWPKAVHTLETALALVRQEGARLEEAGLLSLLGSIANATGSYGQALESLSLAQTLYESLRRTSSGRVLQTVLQRQVSNLIVLGTTYEELGQPQQTKASFDQAITLSRRIDTPDQLAEVLTMISFFHSRQGQRQEALKALQEALQIHQASGNIPNIVSALENLGQVELSLGEPQQALDHYLEALALARSLSYPKPEAKILRSLGALYTSLNDPTTALQYHEQALEQAKILEDPLLQVQILNATGQLYRTLKNHAKSIAAYEAALEILKSQGDPLDQFATYTGLIRAIADSKNYPEARLRIQEAQRLADESQSLFQRGAIDGILGRVELEAQRYPAAIEAFESAQAKFSEGKYSFALAILQNGLGEAYRQNSQPQKAIAVHQQALRFFRQSQDSVEMADSLYRWARAERDLGQLPLAQAKIEEAIQLVEQYRAKLISPDLRSRYFASVQIYYEFYVDLLMQRHQQHPGQGFDALALGVNERAKARSLLDLLVEADADIRQGVDPHLLDQERSLQQQISQKDQQWRQLQDRKSGNGQALALKAEMDQLLIAYESVQTQLRRTSPNYTALTQPQPIRATDIQHLLDPETALLEYALGEERSYLWVVTHSGIQSYTLPKQSEIEDKARSFSETILNRADALSGFPAQPGMVLSQMILPSEPLDYKRLLWVGDGILHYIPFAALPLPHSAGDVPLIQAYEVVMLPSASTLATLRQQHRHRPLAAYPIAIAADPVFSPSDPRVALTISTPEPGSKPLKQQLLKLATHQYELNRLPGTQIEADNILKLGSHAKNTQFLGFDANLNQIQDPALSQYQIIHLATHGFANATHPELSGLVFSLFDGQGKPQEGFLRLSQIFNLDWPAELVVLSACETGLGETLRGEGMVGLTRGFMYAGAKQVLVSLWSVDDWGTQELMTRFYRHLWQEQQSPAAALRAAQLEMWNDPQWRSPYYWAAFTLQGEL